MLLCSRSPVFFCLVWFVFLKKLQISYLNAAEGSHTLDLTVIYKFRIHMGLQTSGASLQLRKMLKASGSEGLK